MRMAMPYFSLFILALGGEPTDIGYVRTARTLASLIIFPLAGYLTDKRGRAKLIAGAGYLSSLTLLFFIFATDWTHVALGTFLQGLVMVQFSALGAIMADSLPPKQRGIGFAVSMTIPGAISIFSPYIGGYLVDRLGAADALRVIFSIRLVLGLISSTIRLKYLKETVSRSSSSISLRRVPSIIKESYKSAFEALKWMPRNLWFLAIVMALISLSNAIVGPFWVVYAVDIIKLSASQWGLLGLVSAIVNSVLGVPAGLVVDKVSKKKIIAVGIASTVLPVYYFIFAKTFWDVLIVTLVTSIANAFLMPACQVLMADSVPRELRGRVMAAVGRGVIMITGAGGGGGGGPGMGFLLTIPVIIGSLAGGYIYSANNSLPWIILTGALAICLTITIIFIKEPLKKEV
jgi:MFS family permease